MITKPYRGELDNTITEAAIAYFGVDLTKALIANGKKYLEDEE